MTKYLTKLITKKTPIIELKTSDDIPKQTKYNVIDIDASLAINYLKYIYKYKNKWVYFKQDDSNKYYPFSMIDELMGSYLARKMNLPTVKYKIARVNKNYGLASANFKKSEYNYYTIDQLIENYFFNSGIKNIEALLEYTISEENKEMFLKHLFTLFAIDIYMIQADRGMPNIQYQINKQSGNFDIAKVYDYSNCLDKIDSEQKYLYNSLITFNERNIKTLLNKYSEFIEALNLCLEKNMVEIWEQICIDYYFNQNCSVYEKIKQYYEVKDKNQKNYIKQLLIR